MSRGEEGVNSEGDGGKEEGRKRECVQSGLNLIGMMDC